MENITPPLAGMPAQNLKVGMIVVAVAMLAVGLVGGYFLGKGEIKSVAVQTAIPTATENTSSLTDSEKIYQNIANQVETWSLYHQSQEKQDFSSFSSGEDTNSPEFQAYLDQLKDSDVFIHSTLPIAYTTNTPHWSNAKFTAHALDRVGAYGWTPLYAYPDKLIWVSGCGGAAGLDELQCEGDVNVLIQFFYEKGHGGPEK